MEIPVNHQDLNSIVYNVARDLIEERAIKGLIQEVTDEMTLHVVDDVIFVIERYMYYINSLMDSARIAQLKPENIEIDFNK